MFPFLHKIGIWGWPFVTFLNSLWTFRKSKKKLVFHSVLRLSRRCGLIQPTLLSSNIQEPRYIRVNQPYSHRHPQIQRKKQASNNEKTADGRGWEIGTHSRWKGLKVPEKAWYKRFERQDHRILFFAWIAAHIRSETHNGNSLSFSHGICNHYFIISL